MTRFDWSMLPTAYLRYKTITRRFLRWGTVSRSLVTVPVHDTMHCGGTRPAAQTARARAAFYQGRLSSARVSEHY